MTLALCKECRKQISSETDYCPHCGARIPHISAWRILGIGWGIILGIFFLSWLAVYLVERKPTIKTREFKFGAQGGIEVIATAQVGLPDDDSKRLVLFTPFLDKTDGNLYSAALNCLWDLYGKKRGLFLLEDARQKWDIDLDGLAMCWKISNPDAKYCVFPIEALRTVKAGWQL